MVTEWVEVSKRAFCMIRLCTNNLVDKGLIIAVKDLESWRFER